ncbi:hypothetical protein L3Y34_019693 [Caenorhabditis briggsae]|uniref:Uncharacterized protein n=1 Tax=Caenorhabditis briggsae TaxID=6238 RepID=A0AAE9IX34_CAEBR|nr:hypothetical protein L3Y34_019693 [Caenorhabditis briggsae]
MDPPEVPKTLTKLSSICVLEYLSFERRQYISAQLTGFRKVEKSIPLHLSHLAISVGRIRINDNEYYLKRLDGNSKDTELGKLAQWDMESEGELLPGDFCIGNPQNYIFNRNFPMENAPFPWTTELRVTQFKGAYSMPVDISLGFLAPIWDTAPIHVAFKKLVFDLLGNRPMIFTKKFEFLKITRDSKIYRLPLELKIQAETLETVWFSFSYAELDRISRMLGPKPLKEFATQYHNFEVFTHPIAQNAQKLTICSGSLFDYRLINHRNIRLKKWGPGVGISIQEWIGNENTVGMEFVGDIELMHLSDLKVIKKEKELKGTMYRKKCQFDGKRVRADERFPNTLYSLSFPRITVPGTELQKKMEDITLLRKMSATVKYLKSNSAVHSNSFSAIAELTDNASDARSNNFYIDVVDTEWAEELHVMDDGIGMSRQDMLNVILFGKTQKGPECIGKWGNGLKTGGCYLGQDMLVLSKKDGVHTALFLSHSFLNAEGSEQIYVPIPSKYAAGDRCCPRDEDKKRWNYENEVIAQHAGLTVPLWDMFDRIPGDHGTLVIIKKLRRAGQGGALMLNFNDDKEDIRMEDEQMRPRHCSLREYLSVLYRRPKMRIHLRGKIVEPRIFLSKWAARCTSHFEVLNKEELQKFRERLDEEHQKAEKVREAEKKYLDAMKSTRELTDTYKMDVERLNGAVLRTELAHRKRLAKHLKEDPKKYTEGLIESVYGIEVNNRQFDDGIHLYVNNRLITYGHKSPFFKRIQNSVGISVFCELDYAIFPTTQTNQKFKIMKDFNRLIKKIDMDLAHYYLYVTKTWIPKHLEKEWKVGNARSMDKENLWDRFWKNFGYSSSKRNCLKKGDSEERKEIIEKECGIWNYCFECLKWKRISADMDYSEGVPFSCSKILGHRCGQNFDSDGFHALELPKKHQDPRAEIQNRCSVVPEVVDLENEGDEEDREEVEGKEDEDRDQPSTSARGAPKIQKRKMSTDQNAKNDSPKKAKSNNNKPSASFSSAISREIRQNPAAFARPTALRAAKQSSSKATKPSLTISQLNEILEALGEAPFDPKNPQEIDNVCARLKAVEEDDKNFEENIEVIFEHLRNNEEHELDLDSTGTGDERFAKIAEQLLFLSPSSSSHTL